MQTKIQASYLRATERIRLSFDAIGSTGKNTDPQPVRFLIHVQGVDVVVEVGAVVEDTFDSDRRRQGLDGAACRSADEAEDDMLHEIPTIIMLIADDDDDDYDDDDHDDDDDDDDNGEEEDGFEKEEVGVNNKNNDGDDNDDDTERRSSRFFSDIPTVQRTFTWLRRVWKSRAGHHQCDKQQRSQFLQEYQKSESSGDRFPLALR